MRDRLVIVQNDLMTLPGCSRLTTTICICGAILGAMSFRIECETGISWPKIRFVRRTILMTCIGCVHRMMATGLCRMYAVSMNVI